MMNNMESIIYADVINNCLENLKESKNQNYENLLTTACIISSEKSNVNATTLSLTSYTNDDGEENDEKIEKYPFENNETSFLSLLECSLAIGSINSEILNRSHQHLQHYHLHCHPHQQQQEEANKCKLSSLDTSSDLTTQLQYCTEHILQTSQCIDNADEEEEREEEVDHANDLDISINQHKGQGDSQGELYVNDDDDDDDGGDVDGNNNDDNDNDDDDDTQSSAFLSLVKEINESQLRKVQCMLTDIMKLRGFFVLNKKIQKQCQHKNERKRIRKTILVPMNNNNDCQQQQQQQQQHQHLRQQIFHLKQEDSLIVALKQNSDKKLKSIALKNDCKIETEIDEERKKSCLLIVKGKSERKLKKCLNSLKETFPDSQLIKQIG